MKIKSDFIKKIQSNIEKFGCHIYLILGSSSPRTIYTIGLNHELRYELIFAGAAFYSNDEAVEIVNKISKQKIHFNKSECYINLGQHGNFILRKIDQSWIDILMLGAIDYFENNSFNSYQIIPVDEFKTIDVPDMSQVFDTKLEPIWKYEQVNWDLQISKESIAITDLDALRGKHITEAVRWEDQQWEMFSCSGPDVLKEDVRLVPLSTLVAFDPSLVHVTELDLEEGVWRESKDDKWIDWE